MSSTTAPEPDRIAPGDLMERLVAGQATTLLDVREDATWSIEAPSVHTVHVPSEQVDGHAAELARDLPPGTVVVCQRGVSAQAAAQQLRAQGASVSVLEGGMRGWIGVLRAFPVELDVPGLVVLQVQRPARGCLSYVIAAGGEALVVDPAPDAEFYIELARHVGAEIRQVFDTHLHADHLSGARTLVERTGATLRLPEATLRRYRTRPKDVEPVHDGDALVVGGITCQAVSLPGHTTDMTGLLLGERALIAGDSLLASAIARPDLERSDADGARAMAKVLHATLRDRIFALGADVVVLPAHDHPGVRVRAVAPTVAEIRAQLDELAIDDPEQFADVLLADMPSRPANYVDIIAANAGEGPATPELESGGNSCAAR